MTRTILKSAGWSYAAGEHGRNRVRVYERPDRVGILLLQYAEKDVTGRLRQKRVSLGCMTREDGKAKADELAAQFTTVGPTTAKEPATLLSLFDIYERDVSSEKGESKKRHDARCAEMFARVFGANRNPATLSRRDWDRFISGRRNGAISPAGCKKRRKVRDRVIGYDLRFLLAVLNWACTAGDGHGSALLDRNPLRGLPIPTEQNPQRPVIVEEQYTKLRDAARARGNAVELLLVLCHETGHRVGAIRHLRWSDLLAGDLIQWRAENDKTGYEHVTPLSNEASTLLSQCRVAEGAAIGEWIFPMPDDVARPISRGVVRKWWDAIAKAAAIPKGRRYGWHSLRRNFASELKGMPLRDLAALGGWKSTTTILTCYQTPDESTQRAGLSARKTLHATGLSS